MSKITITMEVDDYFADDEHETGVTNEGYEKLIRILGGFLHQYVRELTDIADAMHRICPDEPLRERYLRLQKEQHTPG